ncbi:hypothetical protein Tsubulata_049752 [Turnera subulata]|uniref:Leucine-rich repeat-containing N-terminal plant-type domain-containing protein n=1 Tax=Turnera subulata TaxID=218843 RepID=A0A9Q0F285_9ROSI|nr:hypothetical protein Tsubulata_049752 [Turnera subulata]
MLGAARRWWCLLAVTSKEEAGGVELQRGRLTREEGDGAMRWLRARTVAGKGRGERKRKMGKMACEERRTGWCVASLAGDLPPDFGRLRMLSRALLSRNSGLIPSSISKLYRLADLDLSVNSLSGSIPESLGRMAVLATLNLDVNKLSRNIPASLFNSAKRVEVGSVGESASLWVR